MSHLHIQRHALHCALDCPHSELHICIFCCCIAAEAVCQHYRAHTACQCCSVQQVSLRKGAAFYQREVCLMQLLQAQTEWWCMTCVNAQNMQR